MADVESERLGQGRLEGDGAALASRVHGGRRFWSGIEGGVEVVARRAVDAVAGERSLMRYRAESL